MTKPNTKPEPVAEPTATETPTPTPVVAPASIESFISNPEHYGFKLDPAYTGKSNRGLRGTRKNSTSTGTLIETYPIFRTTDRFPDAFVANVADGRGRLRGFMDGNGCAVGQQRALRTVLERETGAVKLGHADMVRIMATAVLTGKTGGVTIITSVRVLVGDTTCHTIAEYQSATLARLIDQLLAMGMPVDGVPSADNMDVPDSVRALLPA